MVLQVPVTSALATQPHSASLFTHMYLSHNSILCLLVDGMRCLRFKYFMDGGNTGTFKIFRSVNKALGNSLWSKSGAQTAGWKSAQILIDG